MNCFYTLWPIFKQRSSESESEYTFPTDIFNAGKRSLSSLRLAFFFRNIDFPRGKMILEQLSRTHFFTGFENPALFFPAT